MNRVQCTACKRQKFVSDFLKNGKTLKTCIACRSKRSVTADSVLAKPEAKPEVKPEVIPEVKPEVKPEVIPEVKPEVIPEVKPETTSATGPVGWKSLSGRWIRPGDERKLHEKLTRKLIREYHERAAFPVHKYLTRWIMIDIRDL
jgi:hypothetical protein